MVIREPECVALKRRGAERIYRQLAGKSKEEQLAFWQERNQRMRARQEARRSKPDQIDTARRPTATPHTSSTPSPPSAATTKPPSATTAPQP